MASTSTKCCKSIEDPIPSKRFRSSLDAVANITSEASPGSAREKYECCLNNSAHGYQYESDLFSVLFARASMQSIKFKMGIEVSAGEKFDDIVFVKEDNNETLLIQIKHFENMQRISSIDLFKSEEKNHFNMGIYLKSFMHIEKNINGQKRYFIFTNKDLDREDVLYWGTFKTGQVDSLIDFTGQGGIYEEFVPKETAIQEMVGKLNAEIDDLKNGLVELFDPRCIFIPDKLQKHKAPLNEIIEITGNYVKYRDNDEKLYEVLDSYYKSKNQDIRCIEKHVNRIRKSDAKGSRDIKTLIMGDRKALKPVFVTEDDVKNFFKQLTFCTKQPENFKNILREEIRIKMRSWIMPDEISKQLKDGTYTAMGKLEAKLDEWRKPIEVLVRERKTVPWLTWQGGREVFGMLEKHFSPIRNDFYRSYVNRSLEFAYMSFECLDPENVGDGELVLKMNRIFNELKCLLIVGKPGMGKTVFLKHIAYQLQIKYNTWNVFMISLKQLQKNFQNTTKCHTEEFINTLFDSILSEYNIQILTTSSNDNVSRNILLFDGFDEITSTQSKAAIAVLKRLLDFNNIRLIISGRLNVKQILENSFESKAMELAPLAYEKQVAVLKLNWNVSNDEAKMQKFEIFSNKLLEMFHVKIPLASCIVHWPSYFTGIPLMAHMLARAYSTRFEKFQKSDKSEIIHDLLAAKNCSMVSLYDQFLRSTFMIKMGKKNECNAYSEIKPFDEEWQTLYEEFIHVHQILAIQQCNIDGINASIDDTRYLQFMERINTGKETSVIINKSDDKTELIHLTYAEYLVALHLYENLHSYRDNLHNILEWNETVRRFVLTIIEENLPRSNAQLKKLIEINSEKSVMTFWACEAACIEIVKALLKTRDITKFCFKGYGSLLHEASRVGCYELVIYLIDEYKMNVNYSYNISQTALECAVIFGHLEVVKLLASRSDSSSHELLFFDPSLLVKESRTEIAKYLVEQNILPEYSCKNLLLATISKHRDLSLIRLLVDREADIECTDGEGQGPLHVAAKVGYIECVQLLIDRGADINSETKSGMTPLLFAFGIKNHHSRKACVQKLLSCSTIKVNVRGKNGFTTFHYAAKVGLTELIETLLKFNVDINGQSTFGESPLHIAAKNNQVDFLRKLLEKTETKNGLKDNDGLTALHYAAKHGNPKCVNLLIDFGANVNALTYETRKMPLHFAVDLTYSFRTSQVEHVSRLEIVERLLLSGSSIVVDKYGCTALHYAAQNGLVDCLEPLLKKSEDANLRSDSGQTPLHLAAKGNHISCVKKLLSVGHPVDEKDKKGFTALLSAALAGSECCMKLLMNAGADVNAQTIEAETVLHLASRMVDFNKPYLECMRELLNNDLFDVRVVDSSGYTALHCIARCGLEGFVSRIVKQGIDVNAIDAIDGKTALHFAASQSCYLEIVEELLSIDGIQVNVEDKRRYTPMQYAAQSGHKNYLKLLQDQGADINVQTLYGETLLHLSVRCNNFAVVEELLIMGCINVNDKDNAGLSALHYAAEERRFEFLQLLMKHGADVNSRKNAGPTPVEMMLLDRRVYVNQDDCLKELLLCSTMDVTLQDKNGFTALHHASMFGFEDCVKHLLVRGACINAQANNGQTAFHIAAQENYPDCMEQLLRNQSLDVTIKDKKGFTALHYAATWGIVEHLKQIVERGASDDILNAQTNEGKSALHIAARYFQLIFFAELLNYSALNVNSTDTCGYTALHYATSNVLEDYTVLLIERGANLNVQALNGKTPLHVAIEHRNMNAIQKLCDRETINFNLRDDSGCTALQFAIKHGVEECIELLQTPEFAGQLTSV